MLVSGGTWTGQKPALGSTGISFRLRSSRGTKSFSSSAASMLALSISARSASAASESARPSRSFAVLFPTLAALS
eukprot:scaffold1962_cov241-Pinguiococcus_pyrenoidosus.AAC.2